MIRNFKNFILVKENIYDDGVNTVIEGLTKIIKYSYLEYAENTGKYTWMDLNKFKEFIEEDFLDYTDVVTENFLKKNYKKIEQEIFKTYGSIIDGIKIINFGKSSKQELKEMVSYYYS